MNKYSTPGDPDSSSGPSSGLSSRSETELVLCPHHEHLQKASNVQLASEDAAHHHGHDHIKIEVETEIETKEVHGQAWGGKGKDGMF